MGKLIMPNALGPMPNLFSDYLASSLHLAVPLAFAALGGLYSERSGVLNIALEGMLLTGAFASAAATFYTSQR